MDDQPDDSEATISQRRADAAVRMAETSLQAAGRGETPFTSTPAHSISAHSTRVEYGKPISGSRGGGEDDAASHVAEQSAVYRIDTCKYQVMAL